MCDHAYSSKNHPASITRLGTPNKSCQSREVTIFHNILGPFHGLALFVGVPLYLFIPDFHRPTSWLIFANRISLPFEIPKEGANNLICLIDYSLDNARVWWRRILRFVSIGVGIPQRIVERILIFI